MFVMLVTGAYGQEKKVITKTGWNFVLCQAWLLIRTSVSSMVHW